MGGPKSLSGEAAAPEPPRAVTLLRNPYHGTAEFGGRPEWAHTGLPFKLAAAHTYIQQAAVRVSEPGTDHGLPEDASGLGIVYHSTPFKHGFPYDDWMHVGTQAAAEDRAHAINPENYGLTRDAPVYMHSMKLRGRVYPKVIRDDVANDIAGSGYIDEMDDGYPSGRGYQVFPYDNHSEGPANLSYLVHKSAIVPQGREEYKRPPSNPAYHNMGYKNRWGNREHLHVFQGARWQPSSGIFGPTTGLDHRLFDSKGRLRGMVRQDIMERLDRCLRVDTQLAGSEWDRWVKVYLAGGSASEWAGNRPNDSAQDLDVLIGVDYASARYETDGLKPYSDDQIDAALNAAFRRCFNDSRWTPGFGGTWSLTAYANPHAWDITAIKPYAAYNVTDMCWAVKPQHLPEHTLADFDPATLAHARAVLAEARAILRMPEPLRTREAMDLWEHVHLHRCQAFSAEGQGWQDAGNVDEKYLAYAPGDVLGRIRDLALSKTAVLDEEDGENAWYHGTPDERTWQHGGQRGLHVGTYEAARQALEATIGSPAEGEWDGTREYGKTPIVSNEKRMGYATGLSCRDQGSPRHENARYMNGLAVPLDARPSIIPVRISGAMHNSPEHPMDDEEANERILHRPGHGFYYRNVGEDSGSVSAVVPSAKHLERVERGMDPKTASRDEELASMDPNTRASALAQEHVREWHPKLTMPLYEKSGQGNHAMRTWLADAGVPKAGESYVAMHRYPDNLHSCTGRGPDGEPCVILHPDRYDYGTMAHETAHLITDHQAGRRIGEPHGPEGAHGPGWAGNYARLLNGISREAGDDFLAKRDEHLGATEPTGSPESGPDAATHVGAKGEKPAKSKDQVGYRPASGSKRCGTCTMIRLNPPDFESHSCTLVKGLIDPEYVCDKWYPDDKHQADGAMRHEAAADGGTPMDRFYHGTDKELDSGYVKPGYDPRWEDSGPDSVYFTNHPLVADWYSTKGGSGQGHVYEVHPEGPYEADEREDSNLGPGDVNYRSGYPLRVIRRVPQDELDAERDRFRKKTAVTGYQGLTGKSAYIYLQVPDGLVERVPGGVDDEQHITICYLGKNVSDKKFGEAIERARKAAAQCPPLSGVLHGVDTFDPDDKGKTPVFVPAYVPGIGQLAGALKDLSASEHANNFRPHVTLAYLEPGDDIPGPHPPVKVRFGRLYVKRGDEMVSFPLGRTE